jgi:hypothetical protein
MDGWFHGTAGKVLTAVNWSAAAQHVQEFCAAQKMGNPPFAGGLWVRLI